MSRSVKLGKRKNGYMRITFQDSQKKNRSKELVFKDENGKFLWHINEVSALKKALRTAVRRSIEPVGLSEVRSAVNLYNSYQDSEINASMIADSIGIEGSSRQF